MHTHEEYMELALAEARKAAERKVDDLRRQNDANERRIRQLERDLRDLKGRGRKMY